MMKIYECADGHLRWYNEGEQPAGAKEHQAKAASAEKAVKPSNKARAVRNK